LYIKVIVIFFYRKRGRNEQSFDAAAEPTVGM